MVSVFKGMLLQKEKVIVDKLVDSALDSSLGSLIDGIKS